MRHLIYSTLIALFLTVLLALDLSHAKTLQGDGLNGVAASENFMKQGDAEIVFSGVRKVFTNQENPTSCGTHGNTDKVEFKRTKSKLTGGDYNWEITKHEGDMTGYGIAYDFSITENLNKSRVPMKISFDVMSESGNLTFGKDSEVKIYIIPSNEEYIEIAGGRDILGPRSERTFVPNATIGNAFSLCFLVRTNRVSPFIFSLDNIKVSVAGPSSRGDVNNTFTARVAGTASPSTVSLRTGPYREWVNNCTRPETGKWECPVVGFNQKLSCITGRVGSSTALDSLVPVYLETESTNQKLVFFSKAPNSGLFNMDFTISCTRTGSDYVPNAVLADQWNTIPIVVDVELGSDTAIPNNSNTKFIFTNVKSNEGGFYDTSNGRLTFKTATCGTATFNGAFASGTTGQRSVLIYKNGSVYRSTVNAAPSQTGIQTYAMTTLADCFKKDDYLEFYVFQNQGAALNLLGARSYISFTNLGSVNAFRPDTFYPADIVTSEVQVGWDRTVTPNKPIYKRCHVVASTITAAGNTTLFNAGTNLKLTNVAKNNSTDYVWNLVYAPSGTARSFLKYTPSTGIVAVAIEGTTWSLQAGEYICMEYTKP